MIVRAAELPDGRWVLEVRGEAPIEIEAWLADDPYPVALVSETRTEPDEDGPRRDEGAALLEAATLRVRRARALLAEQGGAPPLPPDLALDGGGDPRAASWQLCAAAPVSAYDAQRLLAAEGVAARASLLVELMDDLERDLQRMLASE